MHCAACARGTRNLLDLFEAGIDPVTRKLAINYTSDLFTVDSVGNPMLQVELAQQKLTIRTKRPGPITRPFSLWLNISCALANQLLATSCSCASD
jgi:hypothetical protein